MPYLKHFHPAVARWFERNFSAPTEVQRQAWPAIAAGQSVLLAAPTGSGKTLAAFLAAIDRLVREAQCAPLPDLTRVLYVSPLKALSSDVYKNLEEPLAGIEAELLAEGARPHGIRSAVRTGDTTASARAAMVKCPPHILVTTPETLFILLTSEKGRALLSTVRELIVDELHALAPNKRGAHLALSIARLEALVVSASGAGLQRIGLSATQKPLQRFADFLTGAEAASCHIVDTGHQRPRDLAIVVPRSPLSAVISAEVWGEIYDEIATWSETHRTILVFANTRRMVERIARFLGERLGSDEVAAHHGSLAKEVRLSAEQRLKAGQLKIMVATASLELGLDIGDVELVVQLGSPRAIGVLLQRVGRANHSVGGIPKARLIPLSRDELVECTALLACVADGELDALPIPTAPVDVLAQQLIAEVACGERTEAALLGWVRRAYPYRGLTDHAFEAILAMLASGLSPRRGRRGALLLRDEVNHIVKAAPGARLAALTNAGAIPDQFDYEVVLEPEGLTVGSVNEDFAFDSTPGDIFQLGNQAYRLLKVEQGKVRVSDATGLPPTLPFWFGEAPGRSDELSLAVSRLRTAVDGQLEHGGRPATLAWLIAQYRLDGPAASQLSDYLAEARAALGVLPSQEVLVLERFFDAVGDQHLVLHSPHGSRINRAWGLALRKRFCRNFNFELQAAALDDAIILSLGPTHSFELAEVARYLHPDTVGEVLIQALLDAPMFGTRWRWNVSTALAVLRFRGGKRVPPQFQRSDAEDLIALCFPDQLACLENLQGEREIPDHPLVQQTLTDCLTEVMDLAGLKVVLQRLWAGQIRLETRELAGPSPLSHAILGARPYAFLDDGAAEERRTRNVSLHRFTEPEDAVRLGTLSAQAIATVKAEAWPELTGKEALHEALGLLGFLTEAEASPALSAFEALRGEGRAEALTLPSGQVLLVAAERLATVLSLHPELHSVRRPVIRAVGAASRRSWSVVEAAVDLLRSRLEGLGPVTRSELLSPLDLSAADAKQALLALEQEGFALRGRFSVADEEQWCERGLLARIHRYTLKSLREQVRPVAIAEFMRFLCDWQGLGRDKVKGPAALEAALARLEGWQAPAGAWESELLAARDADFLAVDLDRLCASGRWLWIRLLAADSAGTKAGPIKSTPIALLPREQRVHWQAACEAAEPESLALSPAARRVFDELKAQGALFFSDLLLDCGLLRTQVEQGLAELVAYGLVSADSFAGLRTLIAPAAARERSKRRGGRGAVMDVSDAGRWSLLRRRRVEPATDRRFSIALDSLEHIARCLLRRYGVVFRTLLARETALPGWRELLYVFRRLEARGEVRGGRFVAGVAGEQFALPEAVGALRRPRPDGELISVSAVDPLNLLGIVLPGAKVPALTGNRILLRDGIALAVLVAGEVQFLAELAEDEAWSLKNRLIRRNGLA